jgi:hypothetical protein
MPRVGFETTIPVFERQKIVQDRAKAQAIIVGPQSWLSGLETSSGHMGFVVDEATLERVFSEYFRFPLPILIPPTTPSL